MQVSSNDVVVICILKNPLLIVSGTAPVVPYMPTLARQLGFSSVVVGTIYTILPIIGMLAKPTFGAIADRFQRQKLLFVLFQVISDIKICIIKLLTIFHFLGTYPGLLLDYVHPGYTTRDEGDLLLQRWRPFDQVLFSSQRGSHKGVFCGEYNFVS